MPISGTFLGSTCKPEGHPLVLFEHDGKCMSSISPSTSSSQTEDMERTTVPDHSRSNYQGETPVAPPNTKRSLQGSRKHSDCMA